jgi:hypothetical protein
VLPQFFVVDTQIRKSGSLRYPYLKVSGKKQVSKLQMLGL